MKIMIAPDSFKNSCSALEVACAIEQGIKHFDAQIESVKIPIADGGEGTVEALLSAMNGHYREVSVEDPLGRYIQAQYGILEDGSAVIEMAAASGIERLKEEERNALYTSTYGTGQMILDAVSQGVQKIMIGIGGSATNDGGMGVAHALGVRFLDKEGNVLSPKGEALVQVHTIDLTGLDKRIQQAQIIVACDVKNPLCGPSGATYVYGAQKGASEAMLEQLEEGMQHYAEKVYQTVGKDYSEQSGAGAAGGLGFALMVFCNAQVQSGIETVLETVGFNEKLKDVDLVITGEGRIDGQSIHGKVPVGVAKYAKRYNIPVIAVVGSIGDGAEHVYDYGIDAIMPIANKPMSLDESIRTVEALLEDATYRSMRLLHIGIR